MKDLINIRLEEIRKEHKLTRKDIENISGFKARTVESYERGQNKPSVEYIEFISLYFGYKKEYIEGKLSQNDNIYLDFAVCSIKIFQSVFNYDDKKMSELLNISVNDYISLLNTDKLTDNIELMYKISNSLNISLHSLIEAKMIESIFNDEIVTMIYINKSGKKLKIEMGKDKYFKINENKEFEKFYIDIEYYAQIIKQRNQPEIITPDTQKESIPDKYKEILELLPYASDNFTQNLKKKLLELKKAQQIEDL